MPQLRVRQVELVRRDDGAAVRLDQDGWGFDDEALLGLTNRMVCIHQKVMGDRRGSAGLVGEVTQPYVAPESHCIDRTDTS